MTNIQTDLHTFHSSCAFPSEEQSTVEYLLVPGPSKDEFRPQPTRWLETDNPEKLQALDKLGLKAYIEKAEFIRPVLDRVLHLVGEFWLNFENRCSTVLGYRISVKQQDLSRATGLPNEGCVVDHWIKNKVSILKPIGKDDRKAMHVRRFKDLCGVETKLMDKFPVDMIKDDTTRYVASVVMEHLAGYSTASYLSDAFLDIIQEGMNGNVTNWPAHISKRMKKLKPKPIISHAKGYRFPFSYGVIIALLVREQAPNLWQQAVENEAQDIKLLKKRSNEINGWHDIELKKRRMNEIRGLRDNEEGRVNKINANGFEMGNLKVEGKIEEVEVDHYGEKMPKFSLALVDLGDGWSEDSKGVQMQEVLDRQERGSEDNKGGRMQEVVDRKERGSEDSKGGQMQKIVESKVEWASEDSKGVQDEVERKEKGLNGLDDRAAGAVLQSIKAKLAEECAETVEQYLLNRERWIKASVLEVSDRELLKHYYSDLNFRSGDYVLENWMHGISMTLPGRYSGQGQRNGMKKRKRMSRKMRGRKFNKLLIISIEYVLAHFVHKSKVPLAQGDFYVEPYIVFLHPQACRFLTACLSAFKVVVWSEKPREVHDLVLQHILGDIPGSDQILSYSIEDCTMTRIEQEGNAFHGCYKDLTIVWEDLGNYGIKNTILVDTSHVAMLRNKEGNVICPIPFQYHVQTSHSQLEVCLWPYITLLESVKRIHNFVKKNPFGLEKGYSWQRSQSKAGPVTPLFATPYLPHSPGIANNWKTFPSIVTETSNPQLDSFNTQCPGISNTGQQFSITKTSIPFSQSVSPAGNSGIFEPYHGNSSRVFLGFNDHIQNDNNMNYRQSDSIMEYMRELNLVKVDLQNMTCEKDKLENKLQEKDDVLQRVVDALERVSEEKRIADDENSDLSRAFVERDRALKLVKLEKNLGMEQKEKIICSLQETVQALHEKLGSAEQKQMEFQIMVKREVEKETAQIRSTLTDLLGLQQGEDLVIGAQKQVEELRQQWKVKNQLKPDQFMLVTSSDVEQSTEELNQQRNNKGTSSHMNGDKRTGDISNLLLTSDTEALHCSICMEEWKTAGDHRICSLACGHMFGMSCIRDWLQRHENNIGKCPLCGEKAELSDIRILYVPVIAVTGLQ